MLRLGKKELHKFKQPIELNLVDTNKIVISDKFKHSDDSFKYFISYKEDDVVKPLCIILQQISRYIKCLENGWKNMCFVIKDHSVLDKYNDWKYIKHKIS